MDAIRQHGTRASGFGHIRGIQTGHSFRLHGHSTEDCNREWIVRSTHYELTDVSQETGNNAQFEVKCHFDVSPSNEQIRPDRITQKPIATAQTATVVGPDKHELWVDQYARVKIQFHWDRYGKQDENSSCWVRVNSPWQGTNFGGIHHPRIGQEVIVNFLNADGDMPYISGRLTNPDHMPLWELPTQHALSGFKSKEIDGSQNNHLIMDDTPKQVQVQLTSDHGLSQLNLGYVTRIPDVAGRKDYRGQGVELRTDHWGAIRAAQGLAITTYARNLASNHTKDLSEAIGILKGVHSQHKSFAELAIDHKADERALDETAQAELKAQNEEIAGTDGQGDKFPELQKPHLILSSPAGIELATPKSLHIATNEHTAITTGQDLSMSVGKRLIGSVAKGISFFTQTLGIKAFAAKGKIEIQAQTDEMDIIAEKVFKMISATEGIEFAAAKRILLTAGGSYIRIDKQGIEHGTPGDWKVWAASKGKPGPKELPRKYPINVFNDEMFILKDPNGKPIRNFKYKVTNDAGDVFYGTTNKNGETQRISSGGKVTKLKIMPDDRDA
jgi:type VI secretion system secreted protein VgrG